MRSAARRPVSISAEDLALVGGTIYVSPRKALQDGVVLIQRGTIAGGLPVHFCSSSDVNRSTVRAARWQSFGTAVHFFERKWANAATIGARANPAASGHGHTYGFTSVFDLSSMWESTGCSA
jgi:hypothetical protein